MKYEHLILRAPAGCTWLSFRSSTYYTTQTKQKKENKFDFIFSFLFLFAKIYWTENWTTTTTTTWKKKRKTEQTSSSLRMTG